MDIKCAIHLPEFWCGVMKRKGQNDTRLQHSFKSHITQSTTLLFQKTLSQNRLKDFSLQGEQTMTCEISAGFPGHFTHSKQQKPTVWWPGMNKGNVRGKDSPLPQTLLVLFICHYTWWDPISPQQQETLQKWWERTMFSVFPFFFSFRN